MKANIYCKGRTYNAEAILNKDFSLTVLQGGKIAPESRTSLSGKIVNMRQDRNIVDKNGILLKNVEFKSVSTAASFITGTMSNGFKIWKDIKSQKLIKKEE